MHIPAITRKGPMKAIRQLTADPDRGSPVGDDLVVTTSGQQKGTKYASNPKPAQPLDTGIAQRYQDMNSDLAALYDGEERCAALGFDGPEGK